MQLEDLVGRERLVELEAAASNIRSGKRTFMLSSCGMPNAPLSAHETLLRWWDGEGAGIRTRSVSAPEIERLEQRYAVTLPASFRGYLSDASPAEDPSWDNELTNWWPFERLRTVAEDYEHALAGAVAAYRQKLVLFADYSIWCWGWAINCAPGADYGKVAVIAGKEHDRFVAENFDEFVSKYVANVVSVFP